MQIRVIVPCYNEGEVIVKTYERLTEILSKDSQDHHYDYDLLFVDDGSKDKTINYIQEMATKDKHVKFISDLKNPPELIPQMIEGYMDGYDQVIAKRDRTGENQSRKMMTKIYYKLINHFVEDIKLEDGVGDFRLLSQRAVKSLTQLDEYNRFSKGLYEWIGYNTKVFSYENVEREDGESKWSFSKLLNYGIDGLISFNNKPLRAMIYLGLIVFFISLLYIGYISVGIMIKGVETPGYFSTIAAILLLGGIQLISIGIVGEYIGRIYYEVKQRPKYIVQASNFKCADETNHHNITQDINDDVGSSERRKSSKTQDKKKKELIKSR